MFEKGEKKTKIQRVTLQVVSTTSSVIVVVTIPALYILIKLATFP